MTRGLKDRLSCSRSRPRQSGSSVSPGPSRSNRCTDVRRGATALLLALLVNPPLPLLYNRDRQACENGPVREVAIMSSGHTESVPVPPAADEVPVEELARRRGVRPVESVDDMARPGLFESDEEWEEFLADLYASRRSGLA